MICALALAALASQEISVGSKNFTEGRLLGEITTQLLAKRTGLDVRHRDSLGGTMLCFEAVRTGEVDLYVEYTGTAWAVLLEQTERPETPLRAYLDVQHLLEDRHDLIVTAPFGLNNTYALTLRGELAREHGITRISELGALGSDLRAGFSIEFSSREDGWPGLSAAYPELGFEPRSIEHGLAYEALSTGDLDLIDAYSTDGKLLRYDVVILEDDRGFFPPYHAAPIVHGETLRKHPEIGEALAELAFTLNDEVALKLNHRIEEGGESFEGVARSFLETSGLLHPSPETQAPANRASGFFGQLFADPRRLLRLTLEHLGLVLASVALAALLAIPAGLALTRYPHLRAPVLGFASVLQTIPSLALLAFLVALPFFGLGAVTAITALVLYAVLPILRNTATGLATVDPELIDAAHGLGLTQRQVLTRVRLPIATRTIVAGLRTATVIGVGVATLAAFIGAGGLGQPIVEGLYLNDRGLILSGAVPAALLALCVDAALGLLERRLTPRGLRGAEPSA